MKTLPFAVSLGLTFAAARAQTAVAPTPTPQPATPALSAEAPIPAPNRVFYVPRLPSVDELTAASAAQKTPIARIEVSPTQVTVVYQNSGAPATTVVYRPLHDTATETPPAVVYQPAPTMVYYEDYDYPVYYRYPAYFGRPYGYPSVSLRFGFGGHNGRFGRRR